MTAGLWSVEAMRVLALLRDGKPIHGWAVCRATGLDAATVYPILRRFETKGLVSGNTEMVDEALSPRVAKVFYSITTGGLDQLQQLRALVST